LSTGKNVNGGLYLGAHFNTLPCHPGESRDPWFNKLELQ
jgi:hypothetical protein